VRLSLLILGAHLNYTRAHTVTRTSVPGPRHRTHAEDEELNSQALRETLDHASWPTHRCPATAGAVRVQVEKLAPARIARWTQTRPESPAICAL
jgi:hypothetical protein